MSARSKGRSNGGRSRQAGPISLICARQAALTGATHVIPARSSTCLTPGCGVLVLAPSGETGAFDRYGAPHYDTPDDPRTFALAMAPVTGTSTSASGLLFYEGCDDAECARPAIGVGWLRISSRF